MTEMNIEIDWIYFIPAIVFVILFICENFLPTIMQHQSYNREDWLLNVVGFFVQGLIIPIFGLLLAQYLLPILWPQGQGCLPFSWWGAFLLNVIGVDFLYYWQHRLFHQNAHLWKLHRCHHTACRIDMWTTGRNTLLMNFLFVYMLFNPCLGYMCAVSQGFFAGAMITASLELFRHTNLDLRKIMDSKIYRILAYIFVMPKEHHQHHNADNPCVNYGANLIIWDRLFGTYKASSLYPRRYQVKSRLSPLSQLFYPFSNRAN
jgi:sterol desaturase/sphingolipid hydroxylase (fatty acid hydroxylase superfamily)